jgi:hypothetical protein
LAYHTFDEIRQVDQGAITDNKELGPVLETICDEQLRGKPERRSGPHRRDQQNGRLFKVGSVALRGGVFRQVLLGATATLRSTTPSSAIEAGSGTGAAISVITTLPLPVWKLATRI